MFSKIRSYSSKYSLFFSSAKMALATFSSRVLGLVREQVMAMLFGASALTDAFLVAYRIPNMLRDLFAEGVFSSAFVPIFTEVHLKDDQEARKLLWSLFVLLGCLTSIIAILMIIFAPQLISIFAPKFTEDMDKFTLTVDLLRMMSPFLVLISIAALFMGVLNALKVFFIPSFAPAVFNIMMIGSMLLMPNLLARYGIGPIFALAIGVILGGIAQIMIQVPILIFKKSYGPLGPLKLFSTYTKRVVNRVGIGTLGVAATHINILVNTILATSTVVGAVSWLLYAFRLFQFPVGILSVSIAGSNLVHFSEAWKLKDLTKAKEYLSSSYFLSLLLIMPSFVLLFTMAPETVHLIFEHGAFTNKDTLMTSQALRLYLLGLPFYSLFKIFAPIFYTLDRPSIPVTISISTICLNIIFCVILTPLYGFQILAIGTSLSMLINSFVQGIFLKKMLNLKLSFFLNLRIFKIIVAAVGCFIVTHVVVTRYFIFSYSFVHKCLYFCLIGFLGAASYMLILSVLGEFKAVKRIFYRKNDKDL